MSSKDGIQSLSELHRRYKGNPVPLVDIEEEDEVLSPSKSNIDEHTKDLITDRRLRVVMAVALTALFLVLNGVVVCMLLNAVENDRAFLVQKLISPGERLITDKVYMSLIGGTVLQVAAIVVAIARYLFPARST
jgi:hypothetical protein